MLFVQEWFSISISVFESLRGGGEKDLMRDIFESVWICACVCVCVWLRETGERENQSIPI